MDPTGGLTAADVLNTYSAAELTRVLRDFGEERFARRIATADVRERRRGAVHDLGPAGRAAPAAIPAAARRSGGHPAKRTFQALRIEVNAELGPWTAPLPAAVDALAVGGRIVVLAYHSLEDRLAKQLFAPGARRHPAGSAGRLPTRRTCAC